MTEIARQKILIVDDEADMRDLLHDLLDDNGFDALAVTNGAEMQQALAQSAFSLVILDLRLKGEDGMQLARGLRAESGIPIMMLTGKGDETDRILGLELAADDFLMKPFNVRELLARVRALLRRSAGVMTKPEDLHSHQRLAFGDWVLDLTARQLQRADGQSVELTYGEFNLLEALVKAPNRILTRDQLLEMTRGDNSEVFDRTIDVLILRLRRKLEPNPRQPRYIRTERGLGYCFHAQISRL
ncbi:response regulator [Marinobacterium sedimentorum]|uniref:response regulator n=1 Tax=Marinobacterium sedimentorum TaxID=2927804 RepID=UPI0020C68949|nr:response regulator [Marinobacterium sedimentorum]MCP8686718.1 response regulator [Marinobacterium sedimentorum]